MANGFHVLVLSLAYIIYQSYKSIQLEMSRTTNLVVSAAASKRPLFHQFDSSVLPILNNSTPNFQKFWTRNNKKQYVIENVLVDM